MTSPRSSMRASRLPGSNRCRWESRRGSRSGASGRPEAERRAVHAIALAGRLRHVVEDMPQMTAAAPAMHLGARIAKLAVGRGREIGRASRRGRVCQYVYMTVVAVCIKKNKMKKHKR